MFHIIILHFCPPPLEVGFSSRGFKVQGVGGVREFGPPLQKMFSLFQISLYYALMKISDKKGNWCITKTIFAVLLCVSHIFLMNFYLFYNLVLFCGWFIMKHVRFFKYWWLEQSKYSSRILEIKFQLQFGHTLKIQP